MFILLKYKVSKYDICLLGRSFVRFEGIEEKKAFFSNFFFYRKSSVHLEEKKKNSIQTQLCFRKNAPHIRQHNFTQTFNLAQLTTPKIQTQTF